MSGFGGPVLMRSIRDFYKTAMSIQFKFFIISTRHSRDEVDSLNRFLRRSRVLNIHREFVNNGDNSYWSLAVEYLSGEDRTGAQTLGRSGKNRVDYKEVLSPEDFAVFAKLREWRKQRAGADGVPVYTVFTNDQLARMVTGRIVSKIDMRTIDGIGESRIKKYGDAVTGLIRIPFLGFRVYY